MGYSNEILLSGKGKVLQYLLQQCGVLVVDWVMAPQCWPQSKSEMETGLSEHLCQWNYKYLKRKIGFNWNIAHRSSYLTATITYLNRSAGGPPPFFFFWAVAFFIKWDYARRNLFYYISFPLECLCCSVSNECATTRETKIFCGFAGTKPGSRDCILKNEDSLEKHYMKIERATLASSVKSCSPQQQNPSDDAELHIINIPENARIR